METKIFTSDVSPGSVSPTLLGSYFICPQCGYGKRLSEPQSDGRNLFKMTFGTD